MPAPRKRESELQRPRERKGGDVAPVTKGILRPVTIPRVDPSWHESAKRFYNSLKSSGQSDYFQDSDWAFAHMLAEDISIYKSSTRRSSQMLAALLTGMERLMLTEADRRKARIELVEPPVETASAAVVAIDGYRAALGVVPDAA
jgi:hypothetical protein